jgi:hypothetical protein
MAANSMSDPSLKDITVSSTVRKPVLYIICIKTFRVITKYVEKNVLSVLYFKGLFSGTKVVPCS